jgi:hypothetical protein
MIELSVIQIALLSGNGVVGLIVAIDIHFSKCSKAEGYIAEL